MLPNGAFGTGISAHKRANDLSDFSSELDMIEALGVAFVELPTYDMDLVVGGRIRQPQLAALKRACAGRPVAYSVHGPLAINFMDEVFRLERHFEVLKASVEVAAEVGARNYVLHAGIARHQAAPGLEAAYGRQRDMLHRAGDLARQHGLMLCVENLFGDFDGSQHVPSPGRLAAELDAVAHPNVGATIDFSHAYIMLDYAGRRSELVAEIAALAPHAHHLHLHDSFGRQDDIWMFTVGEALAYGHGDLHLPVGWGDFPWSDVLEACRFPQGVMFNIELNQRYWYAAEECVSAVRGLADGAHVTKAADAAE